MTENTEIAISEPKSSSLTATTTDLLSIIAHAASDPKTDMAKMEGLFNLQIRMMDKQAQIDYDQALARVQAKMPRIAKNGEIKNKAGAVVARFMKYEDIDAKIRDLLSEEGFSLQHDRDETNDKMVVITWLKHRGGHKESVKMFLPYDQPNQLKNNVQAAVSTYSYGKRVNVCSLLNIVAEDEDDDGVKSEYLAISDEQAAELKDLLRAKNAMMGDVKRLLAYLGSESIDEIQSKDYAKAKTAIAEMTVKAGDDK